MQNIGQDTVRSILIPTPPLKEQREIVAWCQRGQAKVNECMMAVSNAIEKLREYRTALISAAVTGKIDVRNYKPEPEKEVEEAPCP